jgi:hypothetical protein
MGGINVITTTIYTEPYLPYTAYQKPIPSQLDNGWEEVVARQALLAQWTLDQRKSMGGNTTIASDLLAKIKVRYNTLYSYE